MLYNSFIFPSYTGRGTIMVMQTDSPGPHRHRVDSAPDRSAPDRTAHRWSHFLTLLTNHLILSRPAAHEDADLIPIHSGEDWVAQLGDDLSQPTAIAVDSFRISTLQREDPTCITLHTWISSGEPPPPWTEVKGLHPELRSLWHHRNNLSLDDNGIIWRKRSSQSSLLQLLVPKSGREQLFLAYHASLFGERSRVDRLFSISPHDGEDVSTAEL